MTISGNARGLLLGRLARAACALALTSTLLFASLAAATPMPGADTGRPSPRQGIEPVQPPPPASELGADLLRLLGPSRTAGVHVDDGELNVGVTDRAAAELVRRAGGVPRPERFSTSQLVAAQDALDRQAAASDPRAAQSWHVDVPTNQVVVTVTTGRPDAATASFLALARRLGDRVRVERAEAPARNAALYGGQGVDSLRRCSIGFNARTDSGASIFLTAGHCIASPYGWYRLGAYLGPVRGWSYPGNDFAAVTIANPAAWRPRGLVTKYDGTARAVRGYSRAPVGATVCKSGVTTGWTCGRIQARDETVRTNGQLVYGMVRHSACVEPGDSGGAVLSGNYAQGTVTAAQFYWYAGRQVCGARVGRPNVSWYQPVGETLQAFDARLVLSD